MGRRYLENLDERILQATVTLGAKYFNVTKVTAKEVGSLVDITDATVFEHFQTKDNLLYQAYLYVQGKIAPLYMYLAETNVSIEALEEAWLKIFDHMLDNPDEAVYYSAYRYTSTTTGIIDFGENSQKYIQVIKKLTANFPDTYTDKEYLALWDYAVSATVNFARMVNLGVMEKSDATRRLVFSVVNGSILYFNK